MKVLNLLKNEIAWVYNITNDSYAAMQVVQHNPDGTTRFRYVGIELDEVPEGQNLITNVNMMVSTLEDGSIQRYIVDSKVLSAKLNQFKLHIRSLLRSDSEG